MHLTAFGKARTALHLPLCQVSYLLTSPARANERVPHQIPRRMGQVTPDRQVVFDLQVLLSFEISELINVQPCGLHHGSDLLEDFVPVRARIELGGSSCFEKAGAASSSYNCQLGYRVPDTSRELRESAQDSTIGHFKLQVWSVLVGHPGESPSLSKLVKPVGVPSVLLFMTVFVLTALASWSAGRKAGLDFPMCTSVFRRTKCIWINLHYFHSIFHFIFWVVVCFR